MKKHKTKQNAILILIVVLVSGCANGQKDWDSNREKLIENNDNNSYIESNSTEIQEENSSTDMEDGKIDYDLTTMGSDMVYATVYQMMVAPENYVGKTVKMRGQYYVSFYEQTKKYYHYVIISDALACCSQGIEFIWDDGNHIYPDEYPPDETMVEVTGIFTTYKEKGEDSLYCTLEDATLNIINE